MAQYGGLADRSTVGVQGRSARWGFEGNAPEISSKYVIQFLVLGSFFKLILIRLLEGYWMNLLDLIPLLDNKMISPLPMNIANALLLNYANLYFRVSLFFFHPFISDFCRNSFLANFPFLF